eukprot:TRINITY_DN10592_c0_g1_i2.p1 TRINITY_DN10592_c0_g1~~TRINITY_DN10592_c0_g1_i2.p1  ORF type:complete len:151 (+),score=41.07 TRINITY_DN10592_c0_g1_i2:49-453(+)
MCIRDRYQRRVHGIRTIEQDIKVLWLSSAVQINEQQVMVFGGLHEDNMPSNQLLLLTLGGEDQEGSGLTKNRLRLRLLVDSHLPSGGFWNPNAIVQDNNIIFTQNIPITGQPGQAAEDRRQVIAFDSQCKYKIL